MGVAIVGFVFPHTLQTLLEESFTDKIIQTYREDPDLQNFIDFGQQEVRMELLNNISFIKKICSYIILQFKNILRYPIKFLHILYKFMHTVIFIKFYVIV